MPLLTPPGPQRMGMMASCEEISEFLFWMKQEFLDAAGDSSYAAARSQGMAESFLTGLYPYDPKSVTDKIIARVDFRRNHNPFTQRRKKRAVLRLDRLNDLPDNLFISLFSRIPTQRLDMDMFIALEDQGGDLGELMWLSSYSKRFQYNQMHARLDARNLLKVLHAPLITNDEAQLNKMLAELRQHISIARRDLREGRDGITAVLDLVKSFPAVEEVQA